MLFLGGVLARRHPSSPASPASPAAPLAEITSRSPQLYLPLSEASGAPADIGSAGATVAVGGSGPTYRVSMSQGPGIRLHGTADIEITHHNAFNGTGVNYVFGQASTTSSYAESEPGFTGRFIINQGLANWICLWRKGDDTYQTSPAPHSVTVFVMADGSVKLRSRCPWKHTDVDSPAGLVVQGAEFSVCVQLGRDGLRLWVNGRLCNGGRPDGRHYYGLEHKLRGTLQRNTAPIVIGRNTGGSRFDITVGHFAGFFRTSYANALSSADMQAMALASGAAHEHPLWGLQTVTATAGNLQSQINTVSGAGGGTVEYLGSGQISANIVLKSNVLLKCTNALELANGFTLTTSPPTVISKTLASSISAGTTNIPVTDGTNISPGDIISLVSNDTYENAFTTNNFPENALVMTSDNAVVVSVTGGNILIDRPTKWPYNPASMLRVSIWTPTKDIGITGTVRMHSLNSNVNAQTDSIVFNAVLRMMIDGEVREVEQGQWATKGPYFEGCVDIYYGPNAYCGTEGNDPKYGIDGGGGVASDGSRHPYGNQFARCRDTVMNRSLIRSKGWHSIDGARGQCENVWGFGAGDKGVCQRIEMVSVQADSLYEPAAFACHQNFEIRAFFCESLNGGGFTWPGHHHDINHFLARDDGTTSRGHEFTIWHGGASNGYWANISFPDIGFSSDWFHAQNPNMPCENNKFINITRANTGTPGNGPEGFYTGNTYENVSSPLPIEGQPNP